MVEINKLIVYNSLRCFAVIAVVMETKQHILPMKRTFRVCVIKPGYIFTESVSVDMSVVSGNISHRVILFRLEFDSIFFFLLYVLSLFISFFSMFSVV